MITFQHWRARFSWRFSEATHETSDICLLTLNLFSLVGLEIRSELAAWGTGRSTQSGALIIGFCFFVKNWSNCVCSQANCTCNRFPPNCLAQQSMNSVDKLDIWIESLKKHKHVSRGPHKVCTMSIRLAQNYENPISRVPMVENVAPTTHPGLRRARDINLKQFVHKQTERFWILFELQLQQTNKKQPNGKQNLKIRNATRARNRVVKQHQERFVWVCHARVVCEHLT